MCYLKTKIKNVVFLAGGDVPSISQKELAEISARKEKDEAGELKVKELADRANETIVGYRDRMKDLPPAFGASLHDSIVSYFLTSVSRYDKNKVTGLNQNEFAEYRRDMLSKLRQIMDQHAPSKEQIAAREQAHRAAEQAGERAERAGDVQVSAVDLDPKAIENLTDPAAIESALQVFNAKHEELQKEIGEISKTFGEFQKSFRGFEESKREWSAFSRYFGHDEETERMSRKLMEMKNIVAAKMEMYVGRDPNPRNPLAQKKDKLDKCGVALNGVGDRLKLNAQQKRDEELKRIDSNTDELAKTKRLDESRYVLLQTKRRELEDARDRTAGYRDSLTDRLTGTQAVAKDAETKQHELRDFHANMESASKRIQEALAQNPGSPQKEELEEALRQIQTQRKSVQAGLDESGQAVSATGEAQQETERQVSAASEKQDDIERHLVGQVDPAMSALDKSIRAIELETMRCGTERERVEAEYQIQTEKCDQVDALVADNVLQNSLATDKAFQVLEQQKQFIQNASVDGPNFWNATGGLVLSKIGEGWLAIGSLVREVTKDVPGLKQVGWLISQPIDLVGGVVEGVAELCDGIAMIAEHPIQVGKGLASLVGRDSQTGEWSFGAAGRSWKAMGAAILAVEDFEKGNLGKGLGKVLVNAITSATVVGAAGNAIKVAGTVGKISKLGTLAKVGAFSWTMLKETGIGLAKMPGNALKTVGRIIAAPAKLPGALIKFSRQFTSDEAVKLASQITRATDDIARISDEIGELTIGGRKVADMPELAGKSADDLARMSRDELLVAGVKDMRTAREFVRLRDAAHARDSLIASTRLAMRAQALAETAKGLENITELHGSKLDDFVREFNRTHPDGIGNQQFRKLHKTRDGRIVAFDETGRLRIYSMQEYESVLTRKVQFYAEKCRVQLRRYVEQKYKDLDPAQRAEMIAKYERAIDFMSENGTQRKLIDLYEKLETEGASPENIEALRMHIEKHALEQHFENPEEYVSHGFDHTLNVQQYMMEIMRDNPKVVDVMMSRYGISRSESELMLRLTAVYHDFGYPGSQGFEKALHAVVGTEIVSAEDFTLIMRRIIRTPGAKVDNLLHDFRQAILLHGADKVEVFRDARVTVAHGQFLVDTDNIIHIYTKFVKDNPRAGKIKIECSAEIEDRIRKSLASRGDVDLSHFEFVRADQRFAGRTADLLQKGDQILGLEYREISLADDPMNFMIRFTDNLDMTNRRLTPLQRSRVFRGIYRAFGTGESGRYMGILERCADRDPAVAARKLQEALEHNPDLADYLRRINVESSLPAKTVISKVKAHIVESILSRPEYAEEVATFGKQKLLEIAMKNGSQSIRHFEGCESITEVRFDASHGVLTVKVDSARFEELQRIKVTERVQMMGPDGRRITVETPPIGVGEYQIWRAYEAYRSLKSLDGGSIQIRVIDDIGRVIYRDYSQVIQQMAHS